MKALRVALLLAAVALPAAAQNHGADPPTLGPWMIGIMFAVGILAIAATWIAVPMIFARNGQLPALIDLLKRGAVMRFVTVTYIVIVTVTLALIDRLDGDKVATLLASIAGYVLGSVTSSREEREETTTVPKKTVEQTLVRPDERPRPVPPAEVTAQ
jgi:hypothetical protein